MQSRRASAATTIDGNGDGDGDGGIVQRRRARLDALVDRPVDAEGGSKG